MSDSLTSPQGGEEGRETCEGLLVEGAERENAEERGN